MAEKLGIDIEFRGTSVELDNNLNYINKNIKTLKKDIRALDKDLKLDLNADTLNKKLETVTYALRESEKAAELFENSLKKIDKNGYWKETEKGSKWISAEQATAEFNALVAGLDETNVRTKELQKQYDELQKKLNNLSTYQSIENLKTLRNELRTTGEIFKGFSDFLKPLSTFSLGALTGSVQEAKNFETAFTGVMKTVDETATTTYSDIEKSIRNMAKTLPSTASEIAGVAEIAGQLGVGADDITKFTKVMIDLSNATNILGTEGATQVAQFYNIMGGNLDTVDRFGAAITYLGNNSATTEADILSMAQNLSAIGARMNLTEADVLGLATSLASVGISAEKGGSAISNVLLKIDKEVATNGNNLEEWAKIADMSAESFANLWKNDNISAIKAIIGGLSQVEERGTSLSKVLDDVDIRNIRQTDTLTRLANSYQNLDKYIIMSNEGWAKNSALSEEASRRYGTTESQLQILKNNVSELAITLGKNLLPVINSVVKDIKPILTSFTSWVGANSGLISSVLILGSSLSPLLSSMSKIATGSGNLVLTIIKLKEASLSTTPALGGLANIIGTTATIGIVGAAVAATAALGYLLIKFAQSKDEAYQASQAYQEAAKNFDNVTASAEESQAKSDAQIALLKSTTEEYANSLDSLMLKLQDTNLTEQERQLVIDELQEKIRLLNEKLGEEVYAFDETTGALTAHGEKVDGVKQSYDELINQMRIDAWIRNNADAYDAATEAISKYKELADIAQKGYIDATKELNLEHLPLTEEELHNTIQKMIEMGATDDDILRLKLAFAEYADEIVDSNGKVNELRHQQELYEGVVAGTITDIGELSSGTSKYNDVTNKTTKELELERDALIQQQQEYRNKYGEASKAITDELVLVAGALRERKKADEEQVKSNESATEKVATNYETLALKAETSVGNILTSLGTLRDFTLPEKIQVIRAEYIGFDGGMSTYSANGNGRASGYGGSGGLGIASGGIGITANIHVNNNGAPIDEAEISRWVNVMTDKLDIALGRRM